MFLPLTAIAFHFCWRHMNSPFDFFHLIVEFTLKLLSACTPDQLDYRCGILESSVLKWQRSGIMLYFCVWCREACLVFCKTLCVGIGQSMLLTPGSSVVPDSKYIQVHYRVCATFFQGLHSHLSQLHWHTNLHHSVCRITPSILSKGL